MSKPQTTDYQDEWRDEMLNELLQLVGWYKLGLPTKESFRSVIENFKEKHNVV